VGAGFSCAVDAVEPSVWAFGNYKHLDYESISARRTAPKERPAFVAALFVRPVLMSQSKA